MLRRKARTLATAVGIALGVGTIVALLSVGSGLKRTAAGLVHRGFLDLPSAQRIEHKGGEATTIAVQFPDNVRHDTAIKALRRSLPGITVIGTPDEAARAGANGQLVHNAVTIIATLALILGGLGVTN